MVKSGAQTPTKRKSRGRPTKRSPQVIKDILETARTGLPIRYAAIAGGITVETLGEWREDDEEFGRAFELARLEPVKRRWDLIQKAAVGTDENPGDWKAAAWSLERAAAADFARPEFQLSVQQNNTMVNELTIVISAEEARAIERQAEPVRQTVKQLFDRSRPTSRGNGNGKKVVEVVEVAAQPAESVPELPIVRWPGEEKSPAFWAQFVSGDGERQVDKACAIFVTSTIVNETIGHGRGSQAIVAFKSEPIFVSDVLSVIGRLCGGSPAGWQLLQRKAGIKPGPGA